MHDLMAHFLCHMDKFYKGVVIAIFMDIHKYFNLILRTWF
jgi:hypothetical protein